MKTEFAFKALSALNITGSEKCQSQVAATVSASRDSAIRIRIDGEMAMKNGFKTGVIVSTFIDEKNRALLFLTDQNPPPAGSRKLTGYGKEGTKHFELPRREVLADWFPVGPIRALHLVEAKHGRIVVQIPKS